MRHLRFVLSAVAVALALQVNPAFAQEAETAKYASQAMKDLSGLLNKARLDGYHMESKTTTIFGGWLPKGTKSGTEPWLSVLTMKALDPRKEYRVIASADDDAFDLDLQIYDFNGNLVAKDATVLRDAEVTFRPRIQQDYIIQLRLYHSRDNCVCIGAILVK